MACACPAYIIKNTFLELYEGSDGEQSPVECGRPRCVTADPAMFLGESLLQEGDVELYGDKVQEPRVSALSFDSQSTDVDSLDLVGATSEDASTSDEPIFRVRNTFICCECVADSPVLCGRRRAVTTDAAFFMEHDAGQDTSSTASGSRPCSELSLMLLRCGLDAELAIDEVQVRVRDLAFDVVGAEVVCQALRLTGIQDRTAMLDGLRGEVVELSKSPHGHTVLVEAVRSLGTVASSFIVEELLGQGPHALLNGYTCNVICCLLEHAGHDGRATCLVEHLLSEDTASVCCHKYGHLVAIAVVSYAPAWQAWRVVTALRSNVQRLARHRFAHKVVTVVLQKCPPEVYHPLVTELFATPQAVTTLACHNFGVHLVRTLLQSPLHSRHIVQCLLQNSSRVMKDKYGLQLMCDFGLAPAPVAKQVPVMPLSFAWAVLGA